MKPVRDEFSTPGGNTAVSGSVHDVQEGPRSVRNEHVDGTNTPSRDTGPGGRLEVQEELEVIEGNPDCTKVLKDAGYNGKRSNSIRNERGVETNALRRDTGPGGHLHQQITFFGTVTTATTLIYSSMTA